MNKLKVVFCGTPDFSVPCLDLLYNHPNIQIVSVISMPSRKSGRGMSEQDPEVISFAKTNKIPFYQTANINNETCVINEIKDQAPDLFIVLAFAQFLGSKILDIPKLGCFNIHTSLLPKYRGAAPIQYALLNGDKTTGVSIQKMVKKMDAGDIIISQEVHITEQETGGLLYTKLKYEAALCLEKFISIALTEKIIGSPQDESLVTFAPTLKREDGEIEFSSKTFKEINQKLKALSPWPGSYTFLNGKRLKVFEVEDNKKVIEGGTIDHRFGTLVVGCKGGSIRLKEVQLEGKKISDDFTLLNGLKNKYNEFKISKIKP